jgi:hypothetical protein
MDLPPFSSRSNRLLALLEAVPVVEVDLNVMLSCIEGRGPRRGLRPAAAEEGRSVVCVDGMNNLALGGRRWFYREDECGSSGFV